MFKIKNLKNKGLFFIIDSIIALILISLLFLIINNNILYNSIDLNKFNINTKINDVLITASYTNINSLKELEKNYNLILNKCAQIKINNNQKYINKEKCKNIEQKESIANSITYINNSNNKIYIEIIVYY